MPIFILFSKNTNEISKTVLKRLLQKACLAYTGFITLIGLSEAELSILLNSFTLSFIKEEPHEPMERFRKLWPAGGYLSIINDYKI